MTDIFGFLVGIEHYDQPGWDQPGPCANAIAVAEWLRTIDVPASHIYLFLDPCTDYEPAISSLEMAGAKVSRCARFETIDTFWRKRLSQDRPAGSRLLFYWSGHGFTEKDGTRVFICRDYEASGLTNRVFGVTYFRRHLRSCDFQCFREQVFLADVCGVYGELEFEANKSSPQRLANDALQRQIAYFATPEGQYAKGDHGLGIFTHTTLEVLRALNGWPNDLEAFSTRMDAAFRHVGQTPFRVAEYAEDREIPDRLVGQVLASAGGPLFESVWSLLSPIEIPDSLYRPHYLLTARSLGMPELAKAQGLSGMLRELTSLGDSAGTAQASYGLLEFLLRLSSNRQLSDAVGAWLKAHTPAQGNAVATARERIRLEGEEKILVVDVQEDGRGDIASYEPSLRTQDLLPMPDVSLPAVQVTGWTDFELQFPKVVETLRSKYRIEDLQIQFTVNPPLFDRAFHAIPLGNGTLGEQFVVVVRYRDRLRDSSSLKRRLWQEHAEALRGREPSEIELRPIYPPGDAAGVAWAPGFHYTRFAMPPTSHGDKEKQVLMRLLRSGVAYASWAHQEPPAADWDRLKAHLLDCLASTKILDGFPQELTRRRIQGDSVASQATLLWDDPEFNPYLRPKGS